MILVTGSSGLIGKEVVKQLERSGEQVRTFDIKDGQTIMDMNALSKAMKGCDYVVHLAAELGVWNTENERLSCLRVNINGTSNVLESCAKEGIKKIIFSSSSEIYGEQRIIPITENNPHNPRSIYAITKLAGEEMMRAYSERYGFDYSIVRFFNVYGPGQRLDFVLPSFVDSVINDKSPVLYGDGQQKRCFCHVSDAVRGMILALFNKSNGEIFNIGNDEEPITIEGLANKIISISGKDIKTEFIPMKKSDRLENREIYNRIPDIKKAKIILGYSPRIHLVDGIKEMIGDIKDV